jgi:hypothetical protein
MELNVFYESNWTQLAELELQKFQEDVLRHLFPLDEPESYRREPTYSYSDESFENFPAALLYSLTLITTIGEFVNELDSQFNVYIYEYFFRIRKCKPEIPSWTGIDCFLCRHWNPIDLVLSCYRGGLFVQMYS